MMLDNAFGAGPGASVGATNPGSVPQTVHRHGDEIGAPTEVRIQGTKISKEPTRRPEGQRSNQRSKIPSGEGPPFPGRRGWQGVRPPPEEDVQDVPTGPAGTHGGKT